MLKVLGITEGELKASLAAVSGRVGFVDGSNACYLNDAGPGMGIRFAQITDIETEGSVEYSAADRAGGLQLIGGT
jgi:hypothetical protein